MPCKHNFLSLGGVVLAGLALYGAAHAYFVPAGLGVRPAGMGGAYTAVSDDANAVLFNPAGYAQLTRYEIVSMYSELYTGFDARLYTGQKARDGYNFVAVAVPLGPSIGSFGLAWHQLDADIYQENAYYLTYARRIKQSVPLDVGLNLKILEWRMDETDYTPSFLEPEYGKHGFTADVGFRYKMTDDLVFGAGLDNILPVDLGVIQNELVPITGRVGLAYTYVRHDPYVSSLLFSGEVEIRDDKTDVPYTFKAGFESRHFELVRLRAGVDAYAASLGAGIAYALPDTPIGLQLDYAFQYPFHVQGTAGSHRVGLQLQWDYAHSRGKQPDIEIETKEPATVTPTPTVTQQWTPTLSPTPSPTPRTSPAKGRNPNKIVIGIEKTPSYEHGNLDKASCGEIGRYLQSLAGMPVEIQVLDLGDLKLRFQEEAIDIVVSYNPYFHHLHQDNRLKPGFRIQQGGVATMQYYLFVAAESPVTDKYQLKGSKLGCLDKELLDDLGALFFNGSEPFVREVFFKDVVEYRAPKAAVVALQWGTVDALVGMEGTYRLDGQDMNGVNIHTQLRVVARSILLPNCPVLIKQEIPPVKRVRMQKMLDALIREQGKNLPDGWLEKIGIEKILPVERR